MQRLASGGFRLVPWTVPAAVRYIEPRSSNARGSRRPYCTSPGLRMWQCKKCGEEHAEPFDACWNCGASRNGVENPDYRPVVDAAEIVVSQAAGGPWSGLVAGAGTAAVVGYIDRLVLDLVVLWDSPSLRNYLMEYLAGIAIWALVMAGGGAVTGWIGGRTGRVMSAAGKGALIMVLTQVLFVLVAGAADQILELPPQQMLAVLLNVAALGAIAGTVGTIVGRSRQGRDTNVACIQYSLSDVLLVTAMFAALGGSVAVLAQ